MRHTERFRRAQRLRSDRIRAILASGQVRRAGVLLGQVLSNGFGWPRFGIVIPKRHLRRSVDRNRVKRILREWFRKEQGRLGGIDILLLMTRPPERLNSVLCDIGRILETK